jgi:hypothetical protein
MAALAGPEPVVENFYRGYNSDQPAQSLSELFVENPVLYIGEMPGVLSNADGIPLMVENFRRIFGLSQQPFTGFRIVAAHLSDKGETATLVAEFSRDKAFEQLPREACNIFSLVKYADGWKIVNWFILKGDTKACA